MFVLIFYKGRYLYLSFIYPQDKNNKLKAKDRMIHYLKHWHNTQACRDTCIGCFHGDLIKF